MIKRIIISMAIAISVFQGIYSQDLNLGNSQEQNSNLVFKPIVILETWASYSMNEVKGEEEYANQTDIYIRRMRFGAKGQISPLLAYSFQLHYDRLGENYYSSTKGSDKGQIGVWNAYITAKVFKTSDLLHVHAGYYWAAISREYNYSPWAVSSFDKTFSVWYLRYFLTATGNGIETGIGLAGLKNFNNGIGVSYRLSVHNPKKHTSKYYSNPLYSGRVMISIGDPEQKKYKYMLSGSQWGKRKGITIGFGASNQGKVDNMLSGADSVFFDRSTSYGTDVLINWKSFSIDGEYFMMNRSSAGFNDFDGSEWHIRLSYMKQVGKYYFEPSVMISEYNGTGEKALYRFIGNDSMSDIGFNWYFNKEKIKLSLHYVTQAGSASKVNGDYFGLGLQLKI